MLSGRLPGTEYRLATNKKRLTAEYTEIAEKSKERNDKFLRALSGLNFSLVFLMPKTALNRTVYRNDSGVE